MAVGIGSEWTNGDGTARMSWIL